jgi:uncharacterized protein GlcG (DUF336 family)
MDGAKITSIAIAQSKAFTACAHKVKAATPAPRRHHRSYN